MNFNTKNKYTVHFKDGTKFESNGSSESVTKNDVTEEFYWVAAHIKKELLQEGKTIQDIDSIEYRLQYKDNIN